VKSLPKFLSLTKWRLLLTVLPLTLAFGLAKVAIHRLNWEFWAFDSLTGALFGAATFVIAFLLSGTLGDYNQSAGMPMQLVNSIETIYDSGLVTTKVYPAFDPQPLNAALGNLLGEILAWLKEHKPIAEVESAIDQLNTPFSTMLALGNAPTVNRMQAEQAKIRLLVHRMATIRDTDFLGPAYALLEIFLIGAVVALLLIGSDQFSENLMVSCFLFTSFTYLLLLIRDLDNPFEYSGKTSVDVDLTLLEKTRKRFI
jgi:hypothetical protein